MKNLALEDRLFPIGALMPNLLVEDLAGKQARLWSFRQKSHVALLCGSSGDLGAIQKWKEEAQSRHDRLEWLNVTPLVAFDRVEGAAPSVQMIDRYGRLHRTLPGRIETAAQVFDQIENEFLYYEARHC